MRVPLTQAFFYNFISALSAVLGTVLILELREALTSAGVSYILLVGGGTFLFIALAELIPEALTVSGTGAEKHAGLMPPIRKLLTFLLGAVIIGIPLIFDKECEG